MEDVILLDPTFPAIMSPEGIYPRRTAQLIRAPLAPDHENCIGARFSCEMPLQDRNRILGYLKRRGFEASFCCSILVANNLSLRGLPLDKKEWYVLTIILESPDSVLAKRTFEAIMTCLQEAQFTVWVEDIPNPAEAGLCLLPQKVAPTKSSKRARKEA